MKTFTNAMIAIATVAILFSCGTKKTKGFNLFSLQKDIELGAQVAAELNNNPAQYPILDSASNVEAYAFLYKMRDKILSSGNVAHKDDFKWELKIIHDDSTLNAFCTPGGYIYVYTGLMKYLDSEDQLAGVLGHEIAHADLRHSTRQMSKNGTIQIALDILAGDRAALKQLTAGLVNLKFSRSHETEADKASVNYLCPTDYNAAGGAKFFEKLEAAGGARQPEFLSTHPNPAHRIEDFYTEKETLGCTGDSEFKTEYEQMLSILPN